MPAHDPTRRTVPAAALAARLNIDGLINDTSPGRPPKLSAEHKAEIRALVEKGPDVEKDGIVRWRRSDLVRIAKDRFGVAVDEDTMGRVLREVGFSHYAGWYKLNGDGPLANPG